MALVSKFLQATNYTPGRPGGPILGIVIHDEEFPERPTSAEEIANFFHNQPRSNSGSSAHYTHDADSTVQCVRDEDTAWDAPPNTLWPHIGHEHDGFAKQTRAQWLDKQGKKTLRRSARLAAKQSARHRIPVRRLSGAQLRAREKGFAGHGDVSAAWGLSSHTDPGPHFPWDWYLTRVKRYRWRYFQYTLAAAGGKVLGRTRVVRSGGGRLTRAVAKLTAEKARALSGTAKATLRRRRRY